MKILLLAPRFPQPPIKGDMRRNYQLIRWLGRRHAITLLSFAPSATPAADELAPYCQRIEVVPWRARTAALPSASAPLRGEPLQVGYYRSRAMTARLTGLLTRERFDIVQTTLARMAPYTQDLARSTATVLDLIDCLSLNMQRRARRERGPARALFAWEAAQMRRWERQSCRAHDMAVVVSEDDRAAIAADNLAVVPVGVDTAAIQPRPPASEPRIILSGNMRYAPNHDAAVFLLEEILDRVAAQVPGVQCLIVGADPKDSLKQLAQRKPNVQITGYVDDLMGWLQGAMVAVCPLRLGSGMQFKAIEPLAGGVPVVATSRVARPLGASHERELLVADDAESFAEQVVRLIQQPEWRRALAERGRALVESQFGEARIVAGFEAVYAQALARQGTRTSPPNPFP